MHLKIPPAIQVLCFAMAMWALKKVSKATHFSFGYQKLLSQLIFAFGVIIILLAIYYFRKSKTTIDPMSPEKASSLVTMGIYKLTRNPMYLGMLCVLLAFAIKLGNFYSFLPLPLYVWYISTFQIKPEEQVLHKTFGSQFEAYKEDVRRWI